MSIQFRKILVCLIAVFAISAIASASASAALPELVNKEGKALVKKKDKSNNVKGNIAVLETIGGSKVECKSVSDVSEITGTKTDTTTVTFDECTAFGETCQNKGGTAGIIKTVLLASKLRYINGKKAVGLVLKPKTGELFVEFECSGIVIKVRGSVIGVITPINTFVAPPGPFTLTFTQAAGVQVPTEYEEGTKKVKDVLETSINGGAYEQSGESSTDEEFLEEEAKINA
jgi:hypothetical protein